MRGRAGPCLVYDVGGTSLRAALYDPASRSLSRRDALPSAGEVDGSAAPAEVLDRLLAQVESLGRRVLDGRTPATIGFGFPGPIDRRGRILAAPTLWGAGTSPVDLRAALAERWPSARATVLNDVTAAGYRYLRDKDEDLCVVTVSSGIGNKLFLRGRPALGPAGRGGELGHWRVDPSPDAPACDCGGRGHLGAVASGRGVLRAAREAARADPRAFARSRCGPAAGGDPAALTNRHLAAAFRHGDPWAERRVEGSALPLGRALAAVHLAAGIERFVLFGGFALALGEGYRRRVAAAAADSAWRIGQDWDAMVELGADDDDSGLIGAGRRVTELAPP